MTRKFVAWIGTAFLLLGSLAFLNNTDIVDAFHGMLYVVSGLFAVAASMQGESESKRFTTLAGIFYGLIFLGGIISNDGHIFGLMRTNMWENIMHALFAATLVYVAFGMPKSIRVPILKRVT